MAQKWTQYWKTRQTIRANQWLEESFADIEKNIIDLKRTTGKTSQRLSDLEMSVGFHDQDIRDLQRDLKVVPHEANDHMPGR